MYNRICSYIHYLVSIRSTVMERECESRVFFHRYHMTAATMPYAEKVWTKEFDSDPYSPLSYDHSLCTVSRV